MKTTQAPALTGSITFSSFRAPTVAIRRNGGEYLVCTYEGGRCTARIPVADHTEAWRKARELRAEVVS